MDKSIDIKNIVKQILSDSRFQNAVVEILSDLLGRTATSQPMATKQKENDWSKTTPAALRSAYYYYVKRDRPISAGLNAALAKAFPTYNPETQKFMGRVKKEKVKVATPKNEKIKRQGRKTINEQTLSQMSNKSLGMLISHRKRAGREIEPELLAEQARRKPAPAKPAKVQAPVRVEKPIAEKPVIKAKPVEKVAKKEPVAKPAATKSAKQDLLARYRLCKQENHEITPELNAQLANEFPELYDPVNQCFIGRVRTKSTRPATPPKTTELHVQLKQVKMTLTDVYNDVIVNGRTILKGHVNTELRPLLGGTLLAVHGIITDNKDLPERPLWLIFNTNLEANRFVSRDKFSGYSTYIKSLVETPNLVRAICSNKCEVHLDLEKHKRLAYGKIFVIDEKTK